MWRDDIKKRSKKWRKLAEKQHENFLQSQIGTLQNVLIETNSIGHASNFSKVTLNDHVEPSSIISTRIVDINSEGLVGSVLINNKWKFMALNWFKKWKTGLIKSEAKVEGAIASVTGQKNKEQKIK